MRFTKSLLAAAVGSVALLGASAAQANSILYSTHTISGAPGALVWNYTVEITGNSAVVAGDFFVIGDFGGYVAGSIAAPSDWTASIVNFTGTVSSDAGPSTMSVDSAGVPNLVFTYTGQNNLVGPQLVSGFTATTTLVGAHLGYLVALDHPYIGNNLEGTQSNTGRVPVPIPLPAAAWGGMALMGVLGGGKLARRRRED